MVDLLGADGAMLPALGWAGAVLAQQTKGGVAYQHVVGAIRSVLGGVVFGDCKPLRSQLGGAGGMQLVGDRLGRVGQQQQGAIARRGFIDGHRGMHLGNQPCYKRHRQWGGVGLASHAVRGSDQQVGLTLIER